jgi:hypothetical protein
MRRALVLMLLTCSLVAPAGAFAQGAFGPLPPAAQPTPEPTPVENPADASKVSRPLLLGIAGGVAILFVGIGWYISRDARRNLNEADQRALERERGRTDAERRQTEHQKKKARARNKRQRQARKKQRR